MAPTLRSVTRLDSLPLNQTYFTPEGYLIDRPILTRTGIFEYQNKDGSIRRELRLPEDVFDVESLKSYKGKPVIISHDLKPSDEGQCSEARGRHDSVRGLQKQRFCPSRGGHPQI